MNAVTKLSEFNIMDFIIFASIILFSLTEISKAVLWVCHNLFKLESKNTREKREDHELLIKTMENVTHLSKQRDIDVEESIKHDRIIKDDLEKLTKMFIDKEIDDIRWEILDFASAISEGRNYSKEQFNHVLSIYTKYEKILESNNMENGLVTASMEVINEIYKEKLKTGF